MAKASVFRDFIEALRLDWRTSLPAAAPISAALGGIDGVTIPMSGTFHLGVSETLGWHVFVNFYHSPKAWEKGQFTINVILSKREDAPVVESQFGPAADGTLVEGCYRIGLLFGKPNKWWHLMRSGSSSAPVAWWATTYDNPTQVIAEAVADVTRDVRAVLAQLGVE